MTEPVRIGIVGCGNVATGSYIPFLRRLDAQGIRNEIVAACDVNESRREVMLERFGIGTFTTDYKEVLNAPEVELVVIVTSMQEHGTITRAALEAGKHVMVEKPMSMDLGEAARIVELARQSPGYLLCAPHVVLSPTYQEMWRRIHAGDIGTVYSARALYGWSGPNWGEWYYRPGGGSLFDLGVYNVTSLTGLLGPARRVSAMSGIAIPEREVNGEIVPVRTDDNCHLLLDWGDAVYAVITTGFTMQRYRCAGIELYGSAGTIQMIGEDWNPGGYELWRNEFGAWEIHEMPRNWPWTDGIRHLIECIRAGTPPIITPEHAYHVTEIMTKAMAAGRDGQARQLESTFVPPAFAEAEAGEAAHLIHDPTRS